MIIDVIKNAGVYYGLSQGIRQALEYLAQTDFRILTPGRYNIDGDRVYALVQRYETKSREKGVWEAHRRYIDVQYVAEGVEAMGYAPIGGMEVTQNYAADKDCELFSGSGDFVTAVPGTFVIFYPHDAHMPCLLHERLAAVLKVVVKVAT